MNDNRANGSSPELSNDAKVAIRAYLQRAEARLSTVYRNAGTFIGGAGIIVLVPIFSKDVATDIFKIAWNSFFMSGNLSAFFWFLAFLISFIIPIMSLYLLIKDVVIFHFFGRNLGAGAQKFYPRFSLSALSYPKDEPNKQDVLRVIYTTPARDFLMPTNPRTSAYYNMLRKEHGNDVSPISRLPENMNAFKINNDISIGDQNGQNGTISERDFNYLNTALGLAALEDRTLLEEAARVELSLARHILNLRIIVMRYAKSLLISILTLVYLVMVRNLHDAMEKVNNVYMTSQNDPLSAVLVTLKPVHRYLFDPTLGVSIMFLLWSFFSWRIVKKPIQWIYMHGQTDPIASMDIERDYQLKDFEKWVTDFCILSGVMSLIGCLSRIVGIWQS